MVAIVAWCDGLCQIGRCLENWPSNILPWAILMGEMDHWSCRELCSTRLSMFAKEIWIALLSCMTFYYVYSTVSDKNAISKWFSHRGIQSLIMMYVSDSILFLWNCSIRLLSIQAPRLNRTACYFEQGSYFPCLMSSQASIYPNDWGESCMTEKATFLYGCSHPFVCLCEQMVHWILRSLNSVSVNSAFSADTVLL